MRVLLISDIHANLTALKTVLEHAGAADAVWCLGDIIGYGPQPNECIEAMQTLEAVSIVGNHDLACLGAVDIADFNPDARRASLWTNQVLNESGRSYLTALSAHRQVDAQVTHAHGSPREPVWEYLLDAQTADESLAFFQTPLCFVGHTHVPMVFQSIAGRPCMRALPDDGEVLTLDPHSRYIINPGSVGQPRDGDSRAAYAIFDRQAGTISFHRIGYKIKETQRLMREVDLPEMLITRLSFGV